MQSPRNTRRRQAFVLAAAILTATGRLSAQTTVSLQVQSKSWVPESSFDRDAFAAMCAASGVAMVPAGTTAAATALVSYTESKGPGFSMFGVGEPVGFGTNITFRLTLQDARRKTLVAMTADAETPPGQPKEQFHAAARAAFAADEAYTRSCSVIAGALGAREEVVKLLPWALTDPQAVALLKTLHFDPRDDAERAYAAVATRDFAAAHMLGSAAIDPLLLLFQNSLAPRDGIGLVSALQSANVPILERALAVLAPPEAREVDDRIPDVLATFLNDYAEYRDNVEGADVARPLLVKVIETLGRVGNVFTIPLLEEWQKSHPAIAAAATDAVGALRKRLVME